MAKDTFWFKHDYNAGRGTRLQKIQFIYGHEGKGFYWDVIEVLRGQDGYGFPYSEFDIQMLSSIIGAKDMGRFANFIADCIKYDLLFLKDNKLYSRKLLETMKVWETKKQNGLEAKSKRNRSEIKADKKRNGSKSPVEEKRREEKNIYAEAYNVFLDYLNTVLKKKYRDPGRKCLPAFSQRMSEGFTIEDFKKAVDSGSRDENHIKTNYKYLSPEFFTRSDKLERFSQQIENQVIKEEPVKVYAEEIYPEAK